MEQALNPAEFLTTQETDIELSLALGAVGSRQPADDQIHVLPHSVIIFRCEIK